MHADCSLHKQQAPLHIIMSDLEPPVEKSGYRLDFAHVLNVAGHTVLPIYYFL